jgi:hypothetical protein
MGTDTGPSQTMTSTDIIALTNLERIAVLVHLTRSGDPQVRAAVTAAARQVLRQTRAQTSGTADHDDN